MRLAVTPSWHAGQTCSGGAAGPGPPDAPGAGAILSSQHSGHSTCGRPCRPCPCSHTKYAAPATSSKLRPPPKGSPGALGMRRCIAVHLSLGKAARPGAIAGAGPFQCGTIRPVDGKACRRCPRPPMWPASITAAGSGDLSPGCRAASVTLRYRPWSLIARGIRRSARQTGSLPHHQLLRRIWVIWTLECSSGNRPIMRRHADWPMTLCQRVRSSQDACRR